MAATPTVDSPVVDDLTIRPPDRTSDRGSRSWSLQGRAFEVVVTDLRAGDRITRTAVPDEHLVLVQGDAVVHVGHGTAAAVAVPEPAVVVVPAGTATVWSDAPTVVARVFSVPGDAMSPPTAAPVEDVRVHLLRDVPEDPTRLGRIFRTAALMVNWFLPQEGPRDTERLTPHAHEDFDQLSLTLAGRYVHHLRVPWTPRMSEWRDDAHVTVDSPSMTLIPPTVVHTTRAVGDGTHTLVDVFAPPRADFLAHGWVVNAADYPGTVS